VGGRLQIALAAGEEDYPGHGRRHAPEQALDRCPGHLLHPGLPRGLLAGEDHIRFKQHPCKLDAVLVEVVEGGAQHPLGDLVAPLDGMVAVDEDLGLDYGNQVVLLAERRVEGERPGVRLHTPPRRDVLPDGNDRPPLGEARPKLPVLGQPVAQPVEALGELLLRGERHAHGALVHLDTRDGASSP
jgi:hypothetical protein